MALKIIETNFSFNGNHTDRKGKPTGIVLHHAACNGSVSQIHASHKARGYAGIGYHFYVRKDGTVYRGRPEHWQGAHTYGHNEKLGICAEGNFEHERMTTAQQNAIVEVIKHLYGKYGQLKVYKHKELDATACPGANYPFDAIVAASKKTGTVAAKPATSTSTKKDPRFNNIVCEFQKACINDGLGHLLPSGADGIWGSECEAAAKEYLTVGSKGQRVRLAQLLITGWNIKLSGQNNGVDGDFGKSTREGVKKLQKKKGLDQDGVIGPDVWKVLCGLK